MSLLQGVELPQDVLQEIFSFVLDPISICRCSRTCQSFHRAISTNEQLWERLFSQRWTTMVRTTISHETTTTTTSDESPGGRPLLPRHVNCKWNKEYQLRHASDKIAFLLLEEMAQTILNQVGTETGQTDTLNDWSGIGEPFQHGNWTRLRSKEFSAKSYDLMCAVANETMDYPTLLVVDAPVVGAVVVLWNITRSLAAIAIDAIHHYQVMKEWHKLSNNAGRQGSLLIAGNTNKSSNSDDEKLEQGIFLLVKSQLGWDHILAKDGPQHV